MGTIIVLRREDEPLPEPVIAPEVEHLLNGDLLGLGEEEEDEERHEKDERREQKEDSPSEMTERSQKALGYGCSEEEINADHHALACGPRLQGENLAGNKPP